MYNEYCLIIFRRFNLKEVIKSIKGRYVNRFKNNSYTSVLTFQSVLSIDEITKELYSLKQKKFLLFRICQKTFYGDIDEETNSKMFSQLDLMNPKNYDFRESDESRLQRYIEEEQYEKAARLIKR